MAEDGIMGFKFLGKDDIAEDAAVLEVSKTLFSEVSVDHLGDRVAESRDFSDMTADLGHSDGFDSFDFTEGFDFTF